MDGYKGRKCRGGQEPKCEQSIYARSSPSDHFSTSPCPFDLKYACETMNGKCLRHYVIRHRLHNVDLLREELPIAILNSPKPSRLVLDCVGKFFKQRTRAYGNNRHLSQMRLLSVIVLESMLLATAKRSIKVHLHDRKTADDMAFEWKKRMISEGGIGVAEENDASGLLFLICAFGIPRHFNDDDVWNLVIVSSKLYSASLSQSLSLSAKLAGPISLSSLPHLQCAKHSSGILKKKMKSGMEIEALDVVRAFNMEHQFPLAKILCSYIDTQNEILRQITRKAAKSPNLQRKLEISKHISALNSALRFIEERKYDTLKDTLREHIAKVVTENDLIRKKRKTMENEEEKRNMRVVTKEDSRGRFCTDNSTTTLTSYARLPFPDFAAKWKSFVGLPAGVSGGPPPDIYAFVDKAVEMEFGSYYLHL